MTKSAEHTQLVSIKGVDEDLFSKISSWEQRTGLKLRHDGGHMMLVGLKHFDEMLVRWMYDEMGPRKDVPSLGVIRVYGVDKDLVRQFRWAAKSRGIKFQDAILQLARWIGTGQPDWWLYKFARCKDIFPPSVGKSDEDRKAFINNVDGDYGCEYPDPSAWEEECD